MLLGMLGVPFPEQQPRHIYLYMNIQTNDDNYNDKNNNDNNNNKSKTILSTTKIVTITTMMMIDDNNNNEHLHICNSDEANSKYCDVNHKRGPTAGDVRASLTVAVAPASKA